MGIGNGNIFSDRRGVDVVTASTFPMSFNDLLLLWKKYMTADRPPFGTKEYINYVEEIADIAPIEKIFIEPNNFV